MRFLITRMAFVGTVLGLLAACSAPVTDARLQFSLSESGTLGYEASEDTITITTRAMHFRNTAGAHGVTITGYQIAFFTTAGTPIEGGDNIQEGAVNIYVPAGIGCLEPHPVTGCTMGMEGWHFAPGLEVSTQGYQLLPIAAAVAHLEAGSPIGWHALIEFSGFTGTGTAFTTEPYRLAISPPN